MTARSNRIVVVGAGLAGLSCACQLHRAGRDVIVLEAGRRIGGRVATELVDGFRLDVGFQVLLTAYPEARRQLDYDALGLRSFRPGSLVRHGDRSFHIADPWREPLRAVAGLLSPIVSMRDAIQGARLRHRLVRGHTDPSDTGADVLDAAGISDRLRHTFFDPFFSGVTLDAELSVPADYFAFLFRMFARGHAALPAQGMGAIPAQLASSLPQDAIRLGSRVREIGRGFVVLEDGTRMQATSVVLATDGEAAAELTTCAPPIAWNATTTLYFAAQSPPIQAPLLMLNGTGEGPVLHVSVPSVVQPTYAPSGQALVSVSVLGARADEDPLEARARRQLVDWFGKAASDWRCLRTFRIPQAQPRIPCGEPGMTRPGIARVDEHVVVCGDHLATPSIQGALMAGRHAAEAVLAEPTA